MAIVSWFCDVTSPYVLLVPWACPSSFWACRCRRWWVVGCGRSRAEWVCRTETTARPAAIVGRCWARPRSVPAPQNPSRSATWRSCPAASSSHLYTEQRRPRDWNRERTLSSHIQSQFKIRWKKEQLLTVQCSRLEAKATTHRADCFEKINKNKKESTKQRFQSVVYVIDSANYCDIVEARLKFRFTYKITETHKFTFLITLIIF